MLHSGQAGIVAHRLLVLGVFFAALKLFATALQTMLLPGGNTRRLPRTALFRATYLAGKSTPALAAGCVGIAGVLWHNTFMTWFFGLLAGTLALFALYVVRLRKQGRFFGLLEGMSKRDG